jgi:transcriptional regulator with XRE-family HTH domain
MHFLGPNIRYLRRQASNTQTELAALIHKGQTTIGNWENGISEPNVEELLTLSNYFDIPLDILVKVDLSKTNWISERVREKGPGLLKSIGKIVPHPITYDHSGIGESMVLEKDNNDLSYVLNEIKGLREEIERIHSRLEKPGE